MFENFVAIAIDYEGARNDKVADFLDVLHAAKETVTISYADRSFDYDVAQVLAPPEPNQSSSGPRPIMAAAQAGTTTFDETEVSDRR